MQIDKQQILDLLKSKGQSDTAAQAESQLPDKVDTEQHADLLSQLGINLSDLGGLSGIAGKLGI
jgi:hypothetical protein